MHNQHGYQAQLEFQRVLLLYRQSKFTLFGVLIGALIIGYMIHRQMPLETALIWFTCAVAVLPLRLWLLISFKNKLQKGVIDENNIRRWENFWIVTAAIPGVVFAYSVYMPYEREHLIVMLFICLVIVSMIAGSIVSSITSVKTILVYMHITLWAIIFKSFTEPKEYFNVIGWFFVAFYFIFLVMTLSMSKTILNALQQTIEGQYMAFKDSLTGLWNRRKMYSVVENWEVSHFSIILIDVDHFKTFNDRMGHAKGDEILIEISNSILKCTSENDFVIRYGGEEILVMLPNKDIEEAEEIAREMCQRVARECATTVSCGVADSILDKDFDRLVNLADKAMYMAKRDGRNCVRLAS
jgi:diguanylate cyclase (GGDEF)-like protein